jgi:hypothetical protein
MSTSIYKSHTHGAIPLSATGKRLMHTLRIAIQEAIQKGDYNQMNGVAHARGELAKYMSHLEGRQPKAGFHDFAKGLPGPLTATEVNMRRPPSYVTAMTPKPNDDLMDALKYSLKYPWPPWPLSGYEKLMADIRKDIDKEANAAMYNAMLYGTSKPRIMKPLAADAKITGNSAKMIVIDDPQNQQELDMSKKAVAARARTDKALAKVRAAKAAKFMPVGVRFLHGPSLAQIYTYKAKRAAKLTLGQEVVVRNERGTNIAVVVGLDEPIPNGWVLDTLTELTHKVAPL